MLIYRRTSLFESPAQTLVNTVNCVGVMGKGIAQAFKAREPAMYLAYKNICEQGLLEPGKLWLWRGVDNWTLNFPTKKHWRNPSKIDWIEMGLKKFVSAYETQGIKEISFPRLGCGNGGLDWEDVRPVMEHYLSSIDIPVYIHDYAVDVGLPEHLEEIADKLKKSQLGETSFNTFLSNIKLAVEFSGGELSTLDAEDTFHAQMNDEYCLEIITSSDKCILEEEDLRGVWFDLQSGLVTKKKAGWSFSGGGEPLLSLLSVLPAYRAVEIQRPGQSKPEFAVEPRPNSRGLASANQTKKQHELSWH
jgi:O-acetyl-ADP-ribose deacetylase (regulator of RNase III)